MILATYVTKVGHTCGQADKNVRMHVPKACFKKKTLHSSEDLIKVQKSLSHVKGKLCLNRVPKDKNTCLSLRHRHKPLWDLPNPQDSDVNARAKIKSRAAENFEANKGENPEVTQ